MKTTITTILFILSAAATFSQEASIHGAITSEGRPVPYVNVYIEGSSSGTLSDESGQFSLSDVPLGKQTVIVSSLGYVTFQKVLLVKKENQIQLNIDLQPAHLDEVVVVDTHTGLTRRTPYNVSSISMKGIENTGHPNGMMGSLREVPGVYGAEFGQGIVKPFIRGLGFSRIVTVYQGNKLENHQWGADHGLGVNDLGVSSIDIIKGAASVLYGSGAIGGVILVKDDESYLVSSDWTGTLATTFNSVSNGIRTTASAGKRFESNLFIASALAYENHADYKNGEDRLIGNSRFNTSTLRLHLGLEKESFQNKLSFSFNGQNLGIILDEEMNDSLSLATERNDRGMQLPFQEVTDYLISYNQTTENANVETSFHLSHHINNRNEIEQHRDQIDLGLIQNHTFYNFRLSLTKGKIVHNFGTQGSFLNTRNKKESQEILIPDTSIWETGIYYLASARLRSWFLQGALRYDYRHVTADASSPTLVTAGFLLPGSPQDRTLVRTFGGLTSSLGVSRPFGKSHRVKFNLSSGFRAPDNAELFSNGPHPGTNRFEMGNDSFGREQSFQIDGSYSYNRNGLQGSVSVFGSEVDNYIFFAATDEQQAGSDIEIWRYQQTKARFYGLEMELKYSWFAEKRLKTVISGALVRATDLKQDHALTFIPPDNLNIAVSYVALPNRSLHLSSRLRLVNEQDRIGMNEQKTAGYSLLSVGASKEFYLENNSLELGIQLHNALNNTYVDHMSILRAFNVSSPGRNLMVNLSYGF